MTLTQAIVCILVCSIFGMVVGYLCGDSLTGERRKK